MHAGGLPLNPYAWNGTAKQSDEFFYFLVNIIFVLQYQEVALLHTGHCKCLFSFIGLVFIEFQVVCNILHNA